MSDKNLPVRDRVRNGLTWPSWESWSDLPGAAQPVVETGPIDHASRGAAIRLRLDRAKTVDQGGPYTEVFRNQALNRLEAEAGQDLGPLSSFTFAIKDLLAVQGRPMMAGSEARSDAPSETATAPIIRQLEALGAVATGTVTLHEFAFGVTGINNFLGTAANPAAPGHITGGSSSGSGAAVADGSARIAIGTDTGGSVRIPASFCGVVGFKPMFGTYASAGVFPLSGTLDHVGFFASNVDDIVATHAALGHPTLPAALPSRIGVARSDVDAADADVQEMVASALAALSEAGCEIVDISWPDAEKSFVTSTTIMFSEAAAIHASALAADPDRYGADIQARLELGTDLSPLEVATAHEYRRQLIAEVTATLQTVDVIVGPTTPMSAPRIEDATDPAVAPQIVANTRLGNVIGLPAVSLPMATDGPPAGLQLTGPTNAQLLSHAQALGKSIHR